jgi:DNA replication and repair protein RecF
MLLRELRLQHFRNISGAAITPHERFNIFSGPNGQGKTNILEAIYMLGAVKSFRSPTNANLVQFGQELAILEARVDRGGWDRIVRMEITERGKKVLLNNNPIRNLSDFFGTINVVTFGPEDITLLKGSPGDRRRFLDRAIFNAHPAYAMDSMQYEEVIKQRNALLKAPTLNETLLSVYDEQLIQYGADIILRRLDFLTHFAPVLARTFRAIFDASYEAHISYELRWLASSPPEHEVASLTRPQIESLLADAIASLRAEERAREHTLIGPHRDDLITRLNGLDVKTFASQGQHRAFVLAMKVAEITYLEERYHFAPILLLDDVSSELDRDRNRFLFDFLRSRMEGQVFITTTHRDYILLDQDVMAFDILGGEVQLSNVM